VKQQYEFMRLQSITSQKKKSSYLLLRELSLIKHSSLSDNENGTITENILAVGKANAGLANIAGRIKY
jgi:hypothetical protein